MDMALGLTDVVKEVEKEIGSLGEYLNAIVLEGKRQGKAGKEVDDALMAGWDDEVVLGGKSLIDALGDEHMGAVAEESLLVEILAEKEEKHQSQNGHEDDGHHPEHCLEGLQLFEQHLDQRHYHQNNVDGKQRPQDNRCHSFSFSFCISASRSMAKSLLGLPSSMVCNNCSASSTRWALSRNSTLRRWRK